MDVGQNLVPPVNLKVDGHPLLYHMISRFWPIPISFHIPIKASVMSISIPLRSQRSPGPVASIPGAGPSGGMDRSGSAAGAAGAAGAVERWRGENLGVSAIL